MKLFVFIFSILFAALDFMKADVPPQAVAATYGVRAGDCSSRTPGTKSFLYSIPVTEVTTYPALLSTTDPGDTVTLDGNFTLASGGYWRKVAIQPNSGLYKPSFSGEPGSKSWVTTVEFFLPGMAAADIEWVSNFVGTCSIHLVPLRSEPGVYKVIGRVDDPCIPEEVTGESATKAGEGKVGFMIRLSDPSGQVPHHYVGTIDTTP